MGIKLKIDGGEATFDTPEELARFIRALRREPQKRRDNHGPDLFRGGANDASKRRESTPRVRSRPRARDSKLRIIRLMRAVLEAGSLGVTAQELTSKLGLRSARGLSGLSAAVHKDLPSYGYSFDEVFSVSRKRGGSVWRRGPKLADAIEAIEKGGGAAMK